MKRLLFIFLILISLQTLAQQLPMRIWYDRPATYFEEALPLGNGKLGAMVYGNPEDDLIYLNDLTLWTGKPVDPEEGCNQPSPTGELGDLALWIPEIRKALFAENYALADSLQLHVQGHNSQYYQALATLRIKNAPIDRNSIAVQNYHRELSLDSALLNITYEQDGIRYCREYFASYPDKVIAIHLSADRPQSINNEILLTSQTPHHIKASRGQLTLMGHAVGDPNESIHYCANLLVKNKDGQVLVKDSTLVLENVTEATLYFVNETSFNGFDKHPVREGAPYIEKVADDAWHLVNYTYDQLRSRHIADYQQYYDRLKLRLGPVSHDDVATPPTDRLLLQYTDNPEENPEGRRYLETLYFQYGRYLLISSSRTPNVPANLQGLWARKLYNPWRANYTVNINLEENYWPAFVTNLTEMAMPLDGFVGALAETGKHTAKHYYGINRGWCSSHNSDIWAMSNPVGEHNEKPEWSNWNLGGAWLVNTLWERYQFTQDKEYLRNIALPLMKGAADFCLDWLIPNPKFVNRQLITAPSTSPENEYITFEGYHGMTCYGGTADMAIIRELLSNVIAACYICGYDGATYQDALKHLRPYMVGSEGDLNEWFYNWKDFDPLHRHQSHLIGLYPGQHYLQLPGGSVLYPVKDLYRENVTHALGLRNSSPEHAREQFLKACEQTLIQKGDKTTGWSTGWRINLWARLKNARQAYHIYQKLLTFVTPDDYKAPDRRRSGGTYPNLFDAHPPFQIDGNFGGTAGVCEMLLQSDITLQPSPITHITLLPALPTEWKDGSIEGICARGGFTVNMSWKDSQVQEASIYSQQGGNATIYYNNKEKTINFKKGKWTKIQ